MDEYCKGDVVKSQYKRDSIAAQNKQIINDTVAAHWTYMKKVLEVTMGTNVTSVDLSLKEYMAMREWDYTSAFAHGFAHGIEHVEAQGPSFAKAIHRQRNWSREAFGEGRDTSYILQHILKEVGEIKEDPTDIEEWVDVMILAMHGAWRSGASPEEIVAIFETKMLKNEMRRWPSAEDQVPGKPIEHIKE